MAYVKNNEFFDGYQQNFAIPTPRLDVWYTLLEKRPQRYIKQLSKGHRNFILKKMDIKQKLEE